MMRLGFLLMGVGGALAFGYLWYVTLRLFLLDPEFPWPLRIAMPVLEVGLLLALGCVAWERLRARRGEKTDVERAEP